MALCHRTGNTRDVLYSEDERSTCLENTNQVCQHCLALQQSSSFTWIANVHRKYIIRQIWDTWKLLVTLCQICCFYAFLYNNIVYTNTLRVNNCFIYHSTLLIIKYSRNCQLASIMYTTSINIMIADMLIDMYLWMVICIIPDFVIFSAI